MKIVTARLHDLDLVLGVGFPLPDLAITHRVGASVYIVAYVHKDIIKTVLASQVLQVTAHKHRFGRVVLPPDLLARPVDLTDEVDLTIGSRLSVIADQGPQQPRELMRVNCGAGVLGDL